MSSPALTELAAPATNADKGTKINPIGTIQKSKIIPMYIAIKEQLQFVSAHSSIQQQEQQ